MVVTTDVQLIGKEWATMIEELEPYFSNATNYDLFILSSAIGIMYDKRISEPEKEDDEEPKYVPRTVIQNRNQEPGCMLELLFQTAILSTKTEQLSIKERMDLAFGDEDGKFNKIKFLTEFSNFGITKLGELIGDTPAETMNNINVFLVSSYEGKNLEIDELPDEAFDDSFDPEEE